MADGAACNGPAHPQAKPACTRGPAAAAHQPTERLGKGLLEGWRDVDVGDPEAAPVTLGQVHVSSSQLWASPTALTQTAHSTGPSGCTHCCSASRGPARPAGAAEGRHGVHGSWVSVSSGQAHSLVSSFTSFPHPGGVGQCAWGHGATLSNGPMVSPGPWGHREAPESGDARGSGGHQPREQ